jgi:tRNA(fMet)-specific endonuclease VapC
MTPKYLLDTNIVSYFLQGDRIVARNLLRHSVDKLGVSIITQAEVAVSLASKKKGSKSYKDIVEFLDLLYIVGFNDDMSFKFGEIKFDLIKKGQMIDDADIMIASTAIIKNMILVTNNEKHFGRIDSLSIENWK